MFRDDGGGGPERPEGYFDALSAPAYWHKNASSPDTTPWGTYEYLDYQYLSHGVGHNRTVTPTIVQITPETETTIGGLITRLSYRFKVAAINRIILDNPLADARPHWSDAVTLFLGAKPPAPPAPRYQSDDNSTRTATSVTILWDRPSEDGGLALSGFRLYRDDGRTGTPNMLIWDGAENPNVFGFNACDLSPGLDYSFAVSAFNQEGESPLSERMVLAVGEVPSFNMPVQRDPSKTPTEKNVVEIRWYIPENLNYREEDEILYQVQIDDGQNGDFEDLAITTALTATASGLTESRLYRFRVRAKNRVGWGAYARSFETRSCKKPGPPSAFYWRDISDEGLNLVWAAPTDAGCAVAVGVPILTGYQIYLRKVGVDMDFVLAYSSGANTLNYKFRALEAGAQYQFQITSTNFDQVSDRFPVHPEIVTIGTAPRGPSAPQYVTGTSTSISLSWGFADSPIEVTEYILLFIPPGTTAETEISVGLVQEYTHTGLTPGASYRYRVRARNKNGLGGVSGYSAWTVSNLPPTPLNLAYYNSTSTTIQLQWTQPENLQPTDLALIKFVVEYRESISASVFRTANVAPYLRYGGPETSLRTGEVLALRVKACNKNICGFPTTLKYLTVGGRPEPPAQPYLISSSDSVINIGWSYFGKDSGGVPITRFAVFSVEVDLRHDSGVFCHDSLLHHTRNCAE